MFWHRYCCHKLFLLGFMSIEPASSLLSLSVTNALKNESDLAEKYGVLGVGPSSDRGHRRMFKHKSDDDAEFGGGLEASQKDILEARELNRTLGWRYPA
jgi:hypothetical protein